MTYINSNPPKTDLRDLTATQVLNLINSNPPETGLRDVAAHYQGIPFGTGIRQGDIYLISVDPTKPMNPYLTRVNLSSALTVDDYTQANTTGQLVTGGTSKGASHRVVLTNKVKVFNNSRWINTLLGPLVKADETFMLTHDEHADIRLPQGVYQVVYQLDAKTMRQVQD